MRPMSHDEGGSPQVRSVLTERCDGFRSGMRELAPSPDARGGKPLHSTSASNARATLNPSAA